MHPTQTASCSVQLFLQGLPVCPTQKWITEDATSAAMLWIVMLSKKTKKLTET